MIPAVEQWCRRHDLPVSKFMIPLSYAFLLGMWTLIGTSTNLIVNGLIMSQAKAPSLGMFEIPWVGVPVSILGLAFMILFSKWLLPDRRPGISFIENTREYTVEMIVEPGGRLEGKTVEEAGLRNLPNVYLAEIKQTRSCAVRGLESGCWRATIGCCLWELLTEPWTFRK